MRWGKQHSYFSNNIFFSLQETVFEWKIPWKSKFHNKILVFIGDRTQTADLVRVSGSVSSCRTHNSSVSARYSCPNLRRTLCTPAKTGTQFYSHIQSDSHPDSRGRCALCVKAASGAGYKKKKYKVCTPKQRCNVCHKHVCREHSTSQVTCVTCTALPTDYSDDSG